MSCLLFLHAVRRQALSVAVLATAFSACSNSSGNDNASRCPATLPSYRDPACDEGGQTCDYARENGCPRRAICASGGPWELRGPEHETPCDEPGKVCQTMRVPGDGCPDVATCTDAGTWDVVEGYGSYTMGGSCNPISGSGGAGGVGMGGHAGEGGA